MAANLINNLFTENLDKTGALIEKKVLPTIEEEISRSKNFSDEMKFSVGDLKEELVNRDESNKEANLKRFEEDEEKRRKELDLIIGEEKEDRLAFLGKL